MTAARPATCCLIRQGLCRDFLKPVLQPGPRAPHCMTVFSARIRALPRCLHTIVAEDFEAQGPRCRSWEFQSSGLDRQFRSLLVSLHPFARSSYTGQTVFCLGSETSAYRKIQHPGKLKGVDNTVESRISRVIAPWSKHKRINIIHGLCRE